MHTAGTYSIVQTQSLLYEMIKRSKGHTI